MVGGSACASVKPDYIAFTVTNDTPVASVLAMLGLKFKELGHGRYRYREGTVAELGGVEAYWNGVQDGMGTHVRISGQGCRLLEDDPFFCWIEFLADMRKNLGARFSRFDIAVDDEANNVRFETVLGAVENGDVARRGSKWNHQRTWNGKRFEETLYLGSRESTAMLRVYQKGLQTSETPWLRFEAEFKAERADAWVTMLLAQGWQVAVGAIRHLWEFKDPAHKTVDVTRRRAADWWVQLIGSAKVAFKLGLVVEMTWQKCQRWMVRQWAPTVAMLLQATGGDIGPLLQLADLGVDRLKERHKRLIGVAKEASSGSYANFSFA